MRPGLEYSSVSLQFVKLQLVTLHCSIIIVVIMDAVKFCLVKRMNIKYSFSVPMY